MLVHTEIIGGIATVIAIVGVILNNHRLAACFYVWLVSNAISAGLHLNAGMYALAGRDVIFFGLAIHGLTVWTTKKKLCRDERDKS